MTTPTKTHREISLERIVETLKHSISSAEDLNDIAYDISALLEEARQEAREEMKKKTLNLVWDLISQKKWLWYFEPKSIQELVAIESIIQSL